MTITRLAALGSSFAAGPGIPPVVDRRAMRSGRNYAHLAAERLGAPLTDLTVSGATTANILHEPQRVLGTRFPPQLSQLPPDADAVTLTVGGNDLVYIGTMIDTALAARLRRYRPGRPAARWLTRSGVPDPGPSETAAVATALAEIVVKVRERAPGARVVLVDYLTLLGPDTAQALFDPATATALRELGMKVNEAFSAAAERTGAELVRAGELSRDHGIGSPEPWVRALMLRSPATSFHPNEAGMAAVAEAVVTTLTG